MEISSARWISEWEMEDAAFIDEFQINSLDFPFDELRFEQTGRTAPDFYGSRAQTQTPKPSAVAEQPAKQLKMADSSTHCQIFAPKADSSSSSSHIICFANSNSSQAKSGKVYDVNGTVEPKPEMASESDGNLNFSSLITQNWKENQYCSSRYGQGIKRAAAGSINRNPLHAREHVIAERKRREKLSQRFIALSALIPGLNKVDKASILGGAVRYVKELQDRLKVVEEQASKMPVEAAVYVKRSGISPSDDDTSSSDENSFAGGAVPEIEARVSNKDVLVRIHCHKLKGCLSYLLNKIEKLNLTIVNSSALPFGHSKLDITIVAQVDVGFCMTVEDVVKNLRQALLEFI